MADGLPKHFAYQKVVEIQPTTKLFLWLLGLVYCRSCRFSSLSVPDCKSDVDLSCSKALKSWIHLSLLKKLLDPLSSTRYSFFTIFHYSKAFSPTTFTSWWYDRWSELKPFLVNVLVCIRKLFELMLYNEYKPFPYFNVLRNFPFDLVLSQKSC